MSESPRTVADQGLLPLRSRLLALVLRPTARPLGWGIVVAVAFIAGETVLVLLLKKIAPENAFGAIFLLGVLVVSAGWSFGLAISTSVVSALVYLYFHLEGGDSLAPALSVFLPLALLANVLAGQARLRAAESEQRRREADALATQQAALRRVATLVARGADPTDVYPVAVTELARGLDVDHVTLLEFESDEHCTVLAAHDSPERKKFQAGERLPLDGDSVAIRIRRTGVAARIDDHAAVEGTIASRIRALGLRSGVGAPVTVGTTTRGALIIGSVRTEPIPDGTEARICDFADLVGTAIANAETRAELKASRARVVAAADQARREIERNLHDGAQQRIVSLGLGLRALEASVPEEQHTVRRQLDNLVNGMADLYTELQELSRGIHPAILSKGGLGPAIKTLARRSVVPVRLDVDVDRRLPESTEAAAYYVIAEALTNTAKHAEASEVTVRAGFDGDDLKLEVADDGIGGAAPGGGTGLIGLKDRVEAVSGSLDVTSPASGGTLVVARIPVHPE
ncbi:ATP-binding protein [Mycobacterium sp. AZCC_0083]|uniref:GAF domain-containing sensor histidine kinase n=1 Tax=Mycobacterium sp. AZCC_0083 TaxID=2735882 RepID=UPI0016213B61|nr:ATP-binding protein [Mycobacterium sp. AZCC_0083]MBB5161057.1 signal transduction histidine kinase [Mycobacterium sp. AZCC_0083]